MKYKFNRAPIALIAGLLFAGVLSHRALTQPKPQLADVDVRSVELSQIKPESLTAIVHVAVTARTSVTVRGLFFDQVTLDGVRVRVAPASGPIRMKAGEPISGLEELQAVLTYREMDSLEPLRRVIRDGKAQVHAEIHAQLELSLFQRLALLASGAWATLQVDQEVPVNIPGGPIGRVAALATLVAAEPVWVTAQSAREWRQNRTSLAEGVRAALPGTLVFLKTSYRLKAQDGEMAPMEINRLGFLNGSGQVVAPAEIVEPWSFDGTVAEALERGEVSVDNGTVEMVATLLSGSRSYSSQRHELRVVRALHATENAISTSTKRRYHVRFRNSDANAVLLEIGDLKNEGRTIRLASGAADGWQPAVVVRCNHPDAQPALWATQVRLIAGRYEIQDPVDASAYGSPVWIDGGAVALLQDENSAVALAGLLKKLK